jgi:hypothetical protein
MGLNEKVKRWIVEEENNTKGRIMSSGLPAREYWLGRSEGLELMCYSLGGDYVDFYNKTVGAKHENKVDTASS